MALLRIFALVLCSFVCSVLANLDPSEELLGSSGVEQPQPRARGRSFLQTRLNPENPDPPPAEDDKDDEDDGADGKRTTDEAPRDPRVAEIREHRPDQGDVSEDMAASQSPEQSDPAPVQRLDGNSDGSNAVTRTDSIVSPGADEATPKAPGPASGQQDLQAATAAACREVGGAAAPPGSGVGLAFDCTCPPDTDEKFHGTLCPVLRSMQPQREGSGSEDGIVLSTAKKTKIFQQKLEDFAKRTSATIGCQCGPSIRDKQGLLIGEGDIVAHVASSDGEQSDLACLITAVKANEVSLKDVDVNGGLCPASVQCEDRCQLLSADHAAVYRTVEADLRKIIAERVAEMQGKLTELLGNRSQVKSGVLRELLRLGHPEQRSDHKITSRWRFLKTLRDHNVDEKIGEEIYSAWKPFQIGNTFLWRLKLQGRLDMATVALAAKCLGKVFQIPKGLWRLAGALDKLPDPTATDSALAHPSDRDDQEDVLEMASSKERHEILEYRRSRDKPFYVLASVIMGCMIGWSVVLFVPAVGYRAQKAVVEVQYKPEFHHD